MKSLRPDYKSELGVFSNGSTALQLKDVKHGFGTDSLLPSDVYAFVFILDYAYWPRRNVTPEEESFPLPPQLHAGSGVACLSCPGERHVGVNAATGAWANPAHGGVPVARPRARRCCRRLSLPQAGAQILRSTSFPGRLWAPGITAPTFRLHGLDLRRCLGNRGKHAVVHSAYLPMLSNAALV